MTLLQIICLLLVIVYILYLIWYNRTENNYKSIQDKLILRRSFNKWLFTSFDKNNKTTKNETHRWLFCYNGEETDDCACCFLSEEQINCTCVCHQRIDEIVDFFWNELT